MSYQTTSYYFKLLTSLINNDNFLFVCALTYMVNPVEFHNCMGPTCCPENRGSYILSWQIICYFLKLLPSTQPDSEICCTLNAETQHTSGSNILVGHTACTQCELLCNQKTKTFIIGNTALNHSKMQFLSDSTPFPSPHNF